MKNKLKEYAKTIGIEYIGVTSAAPMVDLKDYLLSIGDKSQSDFCENDIEKRCNAHFLMEDAKSIIVYLLPYCTGENNESNISKYAQIPDYHNVSKELSDKLCRFIKQHENHAKTLCFSDTGPLCDKYLAYKAGLGFFGKNTLLINEKYGSFVFIAYIVTNIELLPDTPKNKTCIGCNECIKKCPGQALGNNFEFDEKKCVSYITQINEISDTQLKILSSQNSVYGCDACQNVCPHNKNIPKTPIKEFCEKSLYKLNKNEIEKMSNNEFKRKFSDFAFSWRGKKAILKNFSDNA